MSLRSILPGEARRLLEQGAILVDVREPNEHAQQSIPGARLQPLSSLDQPLSEVGPGAALIFHCQSGARTSINARRLLSRVPASSQGYLLEGGINAWQRAGLPVTTNARS